MGIRIAIGFLHSNREVAFESDLSTQEAEKTISAALAEGEGQLKLSDNRGRVYIMPTRTVAYAEVGAEEARKIGFVG